MTTTPQAAAAKWAQNLSAAGPQITAGVAAVSVAPGQAAARQKAVYLAQVAANGDKWAKNVGAVSLQDWQAATTSKGIPRIAAGATAAQPKMEAFMNKLLPAIAQVKSTLPARGNLEQNITRMTAFTRGMAAMSLK